MDALDLVLIMLTPRPNAAYRGQPMMARMLLYLLTLVTCLISQAYSNANFSVWSDYTDAGFPKNKLVDQCE